ncbi:hypothetical protein [Sporosarcina psychrophila]|uniref:hypothetical protein n=1 Tax=Sporosarcina psychrophila TaxID=1476 RepID=UPI00078C5015|nr:hypothetical protein [Sporosarcina psychrophila]AMQ06721.1 hypothetical protein AZE41_12700 [Sporosarcina psychrophila]
MLVIIEALKVLDEHKWLMALLAILGPWVIYIIKTVIENFNNIQLERKLNSNLINIYQELFLICATFVSMFFVLIITTSDVRVELVEKSSDWIVFIAYLLVDIVITFIIIVVLKVILYLITPKYDYYVLINETDEKPEWKLIKHSGKRGYLVRNNKGVIYFIQDISTIKFKEVKREK